MTFVDIDPAIIGDLTRKEGVDVCEVEDWLNKKSDLLDLSKVSHHTWEIMAQFDTKWHSVAASLFLIQTL